MLDSPADIRERISRVEKARVDEVINEQTLSETVVFFIFFLQDAQTPDKPRHQKVDFPHDTRDARTSTRKTLSSSEKRAFVRESRTKGYGVAHRRRNEQHPRFSAESGLKTL